MNEQGIKELEIIRSYIYVRQNAVKIMVKFRPRYGPELCHILPMFLYAPLKIFLKLVLKV